MYGNYFEGIPKSVPTEDEEKLTVECYELSDIMSEALFILDFQKRNFLHVSPHNLFLCGYTSKQVKEAGYDFFKIIFHPDDLPLWMNIHATILKSIYKNKLPIEKIKFFGCTLRIKNFLSDNDKRSDYFMVYLKLKPKFQHDVPRLGICLLSVSVVPKSGNLCVYYKNHDHSSYSFISRKWTFHLSEPLSKREKQILTWSQEGLTNKEMADKLLLTAKVIEKAKTSLFDKLNIVDELNLNSFSKKLRYANNRCLIY